MPVRREKAWEVALSDDGDFLRYRVVKEDGNVVDFLVQYEATVDSNRVPVVRYDGSHPRCHYDRYTRHGEKSEQHWLNEILSVKDCLTLGQRDL